MRTSLTDGSTATVPAGEPLVSVIVPAFNHERFIGRCLDSIAENDYTNKEIVVIDDGSSDGTSNAVRAWADRPGRATPISFVSRPNRGVTPTLNELLGMAHGDLVLPVASDDYLLPGGIRALVAALAADPDARAVFGECIVVDDADQTLFSSTLSGYRKTNREWLVRRLADELITNWTLAGPALLYDRESILSIGGYREDLIIEDWDFYLRLAAKGWLRFADCKVAAYRLHDTNQHLNPETVRRGNIERRRVALAAALEFRGRRRLILRLEALSYAGPLLGLQRGKPSQLPQRVARKAIRVTARALASIGSGRV